MKLMEELAIFEASANKGEDWSDKKSLTEGGEEGRFVSQ